MKSKKVIISLIIILSLVVISLIVLLIMLLNNKFKFPLFMFGNKVSDELILDEIYDLDFNNINIEANASNIYIKTSSDNHVRVVVYSDAKDVVVETNNNVLKVKSKGKKCVGFCFNFKLTKIEIYLPEDYDKSINIQNNYGNVEIEEFLNADINIEEDCGDVSILGGNVVNVNNKYGDIAINKANTGNIKEDCGDVKIGTINDVTVSNSYGDIKISMVNNYLNLKNNCGDIKVDKINLNKNSTITDDLGDIKIGTTNEIYIDAKTSLGDLKINNNYNKSDITLKIKNNCGDIKVNN